MKTNLNPLKESPKLLKEQMTVFWCVYIYIHITWQSRSWQKFFWQIYLPFLHSNIGRQETWTADDAPNLNVNYETKPKIRSMGFFRLSDLILQCDDLHRALFCSIFSLFEMGASRWALLGNAAMLKTSQTSPSIIKCISNQIWQLKLGLWLNVKPHEMIYGITLHWEWKDGGTPNLLPFSTNLGEIWVFKHFNPSQSHFVSPFSRRL